MASPKTITLKLADTRLPASQQPHPGQLILGHDGTRYRVIRVDAAKRTVKVRIED